MCYFHLNPETYMTHVQRSDLHFHRRRYYHNYSMGNMQDVELLHTGPMSFGSSKSISRILMGSVKKDVLVIDISDVPFIDSSDSIALEEVIV